MDTRNCDVSHDPGAAPIKLWTRAVPLEDEAREQLRNIAPEGSAHYDDYVFAPCCPPRSAADGLELGGLAHQGAFRCPR